MTTTPSDVELNEDLTLAAAMETWAREHGKGAGFLLLEGARAIRRLSDARGAVIEVMGWNTTPTELLEKAQCYMDGFDGKNEVNVGPLMLRCMVEELAIALRALSHPQPESEITKDALDKIIARQDELFNNLPNCPKCGHEQVQIVDKGNPAQWRCRICKHTFEFEPSPTTQKDGISEEEARELLAKELERRGRSVVARSVRENPVYSVDINAEIAIAAIQSASRLAPPTSPDRRG